MNTKNNKNANNMDLNDKNSNDKNSKQNKKANQMSATQYEEYIKDFTPKPKLFKNCIFAFLSGGILCVLCFYCQTIFENLGYSEKTSATFVLILLICLAQLLTGFGLFDKIAKFAGAGVIVPISGFANSMVSPAMEFKKEGLVLGIGAKLFSVAGPVLVCGISVSTLIGLIYYYFFI